MKFRTFVSTFLLLTTLTVFSQNELYSALTIPKELKENANAVVRYDDIDIIIKASNKMVFNNKRIVTILNSSGNSKLGTSIGYDDNTSIKKLEARIYNQFGKEIKRIKKNNFVDVSAVDGGTLYSDSRVKYLNYTPIDYPYTVAFEAQVEYNSTAFVPGWRPIEGYYISTQLADYKITNETDIEIKIKTTNFNSINIEKQNEFHYIANNLKAIKPEVYSPSFKKHAPFLKAALTRFDMEGVEGVNNNWKDFGKWINDKLIFDTQELPIEVKSKIKALTVNATTDIEKAKIVYKFMQNKTRYISVQVGIGGWKPIVAGDVDELGYGDCKGLSNYTKALLDEVGVDSYYTVIYGGRKIIDFDKDFSVAQGNHAILCLPNGEDYIWLECTNQTVPFGYTANFTDDRDALIVTPEGGKIVHTKVYKTKDNSQITNAKVKLEVNGGILGKVNIESRGTQYDHHEGTQEEKLENQELYYKDYWDNINNLSIQSMKFNNDKDSIVFKEEVTLSAIKYSRTAGNRILFEPNMFNRFSSAPPRYKNRKLPFEIDRGFIDIDKYEITLPKELEVEALQNEIQLSNKFGEYKFSIKKKTDNTLIFNRTLILNKGKYKKEDYKPFRDFWLKIVKYDKSKIVLINKP
jgi:Domain of Unknown Function with PDB structure (DUF3857)/Domain of Unknown Function with PDB structure (DUF3858)